MKLWYVILSLLVSVAGFSQASSNKFLINTSDNFFSITARENPELLFDNQITQKMDLDGVVASFSNPMEFVVELKDSVWNHMKLRFYNGFGATQTWQVIFYDSNRVARGTYSIDGAAFPFMGYYTMPQQPDTISVPIRYIYFNLSNAGSDVREIEISGDKVAKATTILSHYAAIPKRQKTDPGRYYNGGGALVGKDTTYWKLASGYNLYESFRYTGQNTWVYNRDPAYPWFQQPNLLNTEGDFWTVGNLSFLKSRGVRVQSYVNAPSIKADPTGTLTKTSNYGVVLASGINFWKDIPKGSDSTDPAQWANRARHFAARTAMYGTNASADTAGLAISDDGVHTASNKTRGRAAEEVEEIGNEDDKDWGGVTGYHSPRVVWAYMRATYDSIKARDPNMPVYMGATIKIDTNFVKAVIFLDYWKRGVKAQPPMDGFCINQYLSTAYGGQPQDASYTAITPGQFQMDTRGWFIGKFRDRFLPNGGIRWTEIGFSITASPYDIHAVTGMGDTTVAAAMQIRSYEVSALAWGVFDVMFNYLNNSDGSGYFNGMFLLREKFNGGGAYIGSDKLPLWYALAMRSNTLHDYNAWGRAFKHGDSTGVYVVERDHVTDLRKKCYSVWSETYNGLSSSVTIPVGSATSATLYTYSFGSETGTATPLTISNKTVTITANEMPQYIQTVQSPFPWPFKVTLGGYRTQ